MNGLTLLNAWGLLALAALLLPLAIHLFSRSRGRRVLVGNIALYRQPRRQRVFEARVQQWPLLLLRLLLLIVAALWVAELAREQRPSLAGTTAYVTPDWLAAQGREGAANIDADRVLALIPSFPPVDAYVSTSSASGSDWYGLLAERLAAVDHKGGVTVYALGAADQFPASATGFGAGVRWVLATPGAEPGAEKEKPNPSLVVSVYHEPGRKTDAVSITTALALAAEQRQVRLDIAMTEVASGDADVTTPIFDQAPADAMRVAIGLGVNVDHLSATVALEDVAPGTIATTLQLPSLPGHRFEVRPAVQQPSVDAGVMGDAPPQVLWRADNGQPLLIETSVAGGRHLRYLDRLSEVADSPLRSEAFPELLLRLLLGETAWQQGYAQAPVDPTLTLSNSGRSPAVPNQPLAPWLALLLALLVAVERWWAERLSAESSQ
ncbi:MAG: BatA domain-containing protein [Halieaceae bacterium]|nr:BatA domain-containing protein [Halieaceae bacterium]